MIKNSLLNNPSLYLQKHMGAAKTVKLNVLPSPATIGNCLANQNYYFYMCGTFKTPEIMRHVTLLTFECDFVSYLPRSDRLPTPARGWIYIMEIANSKKYGHCSVAVCPVVGYTHTYTHIYIYIIYVCVCVLLWDIRLYIIIGFS